MAAAPWIVSDELWELVEPLLPKKERRFRYPGRSACRIGRRCRGSVRAAHRDRLAASAGRARLRLGSTCWRRLDEWQRAGVWERLHALLLPRLRAAGEIEWSRAVADSSHVQAKKGAPRRARARWIEARPGSKHHLLVDATGIPLAWTLTGGNRNDITQLIPLLDGVPAVRRPRRPAAPTTRHRDRRPRLRPRPLPASFASAGSQP